MTTFEFSSFGDGHYGLIIHVADLRIDSFGTLGGTGAPTLILPATTDPAVGSRVLLRIAGVGQRSLALESRISEIEPPEAGVYRVHLEVSAAQAHRVWALRDRIRNSLHAEGGPKLRLAAMRTPELSEGSEPAPKPAVRLGEAGATDWRVKAGPWMLGRLNSEGQGRLRRFSLRVPAPVPVKVGQTVILTAELVDGADPVELAAVVAEADASSRTAEVSGVPGEVRLRIVPSHRHRVEYIQAVITGQRRATRRSTTRFDTRILAGLMVRDREINARAESVSESGLFVCCHHHPTVGREVQIRLQPARTPAIELKGEVRWHSEEARRPGFGLHFGRLHGLAAQHFRHVITGLASPSPA